MGLDGELTFSLEENEFGKITVVELIPNGNEVLVTDQNKAEYVHLLAHHRMTSAIRRQVSHPLPFHSLSPLISTFSPDRLLLGGLLRAGALRADLHLRRP
jgi:E3 ubiquitin-protein ligase HUWE1